MNDANRLYESDEGEGEFYGFGGGRLGGLGEGVTVDIINNERNAENENAGNEVQSDGSEEETDDEEELAERGNQGELALVRSLPPVPPFEPYKHPKPSHKRILNLPHRFSGQPDAAGVDNPDNQSSRSPLDFFMLLFDQGQFENLALNTNAYARMKEAGRNGSRRWYPTQAGEIMIFVGLIIYMGLYHSSAIPDYWRKDGLAPLHR